MLISYIGETFHQVGRINGCRNIKVSKFRSCVQKTICMNLVCVLPEWWYGPVLCKEAPYLQSCVQKTICMNLVCVLPEWWYGPVLCKAAPYLQGCVQKTICNESCMCPSRMVVRSGAVQGGAISSRLCSEDNLYESCMCPSRMVVRSGAVQGGAFQNYLQSCVQKTICMNLVCVLPEW